LLDALKARERQLLTLTFVVAVARQRLTALNCDGLARSFKHRFWHESKIN
jgi:hypothetical protein